LRERQVAEAIAGGANNKEIARQLGIAERTVKSHTTTIFDKLGVDDRLKLALKIIALKK
jgi:DNA-binding NarL/FixJ family response regulator